MTLGRLYGEWKGAVHVVLIAGFALLGGCTTYVQTQVAAFSDWSGTDATRTYAFMRSAQQQNSIGSAQQQNSIEQKTYEALAANELATHSFKQAPDASANYRVELSYSIRDDMVTVRQPVYYDPWPMYGGWYGRPYGWGGYGGWGAWDTGPTGYVDQSYPIFVHSLQIRMTERESGREVYKVTASNSGGESSLVRAMPYLIRSALADFPLGNGTVRTVKIPLDKTGGVGNEAPVAVGTNEKVATPAPVPAPVPVQ
ncbi:MAG: Putative transmembrane lipoprotein [uncultured Caballeronia sp.]|nr:MAG: Putative transmembrane lipoprotein [uncultured Caballeronia sp.]